MATFNLSDHPHRRYNPLTGEWILVSPHRAKRPWQGQQEAPPTETRPVHDPACYLCPRNTRVGGVISNPDYVDTFVFENDFSAMLADVPDGEIDEDGLLVARSERGICRVICFSPRHDLTLAEMEVGDIRRVVDLWTTQYEELGALDFINHVQIFENKGQVMGCSNPHPHGQIWAQGSLPQSAAKELHHQRAYLEARGTTLLSDYLQKELAAEARIIAANEAFVSLVPFWATWPFEAMVLCRRRVASLSEMEPSEKDALAAILKDLLVRYDNLFQTSFPYSAGLHQAPTDGAAHPEWDWHFHAYPPLLRSASVKKFMVGYEMLGEAQRDITPETAAERLRAMPTVHYRSV